MVDLAIFLMDLGGGGAERVMLNLARGFIEKGLTVDLVLVKAEGPYLSQLPEKARVIKLDCSRLIASLPVLISYLRQEKPRVLISALEDTNLVALWAKKVGCLSTNVIVTVHNHLSRSCKNSTELKRRLTPTLVRFFYPWAGSIVAVSQGVASDLLTMRLPAEKVVTIYNPIVTPELYEKAQEIIEHPWFVPEQPPVLLSVGRLTKQKDFPTLIRAFSQVRQFKPCRLMILGEGEEYENLLTLVKELGLERDVLFAGFTTNPYVYMAKAAVLVLPSAWEGFGNVLVEAMAVGTPVVATNCESGPSEILENGRYGQLVPVGNFVEMARAILLTLENDPAKEIIQERSREFTLEIAVDQYCNLI